MTVRATGLPETVHIIPLGHEIDRAVKPLMNKKVDRVHLLAISPEADIDPVMREKQVNYTRKVTDHLESVSIPVQFHPVEMFDVLDVLKNVSRIIVQEKTDGNNVYVNMSACGRKTSFAVTVAAMYHEVVSYYVAADGYATGENSGKEIDHGMSIVESGNIELLQQFQIMKPKDINVELLAELYRRKMNNTPYMKSDEIINFLHERKVHGFEIKPEEKRGLDKSKHRRALLNRISRSHLEELEGQKYIEKKKIGKEFSVRITPAGSHIACVSGLVK